MTKPDEKKHATYAADYYEMEYGCLSDRENVFRMYFEESIPWIVGQILDYKMKASGCKYLGDGIGTLKIIMPNKFDEKELVGRINRGLKNKDFSPCGMVGGEEYSASIIEHKRVDDCTLQVKILFEAPQ